MHCTSRTGAGGKRRQSAAARAVTAEGVFTRQGSHSAVRCDTSARTGQRRHTTASVAMTKRPGTRARSATRPTLPDHYRRISTLSLVGNTGHAAACLVTKWRPNRVHVLFESVFDTKFQELFSAKGLNSFYFSNEQYLEIINSVKSAKEAKSKNYFTIPAIEAF
ncbi:hypothetical protein ACJJTC_001299 [Scirpophaga incertulas]